MSAVQAVAVLRAKRATVDIPLRLWAEGELTLLRLAFQYGGHGHHGGKQWKPSIAAVRERRKTLVRTGLLRGSMRLNVISGVTPVAVFSNPVYYAGFHQSGTRHMPQRKIVDITKQDQNRLRAQLIHHFNAG